MTQVIRSGAFLQQCWSVHPLCLSVKRMTDEHAVVLSCSSCKSTHHLTASAITSKVSAASSVVDGQAGSEEPPGEELLKTCVSVHRAAVTLREMDVFQDVVRLRCADCRRLYELTIAVFETHHK